MDPQTAGFETAVDEPTVEGEQEGVRETGRLEAFSDGVFAIAVTLLILTIQVPSPLTTKPNDLGPTLLTNWPAYTAYLISFAFILVMWVNHHNLFRLIQRTDQTFLLLNGLLLLFVTVVPFPTALVAEYLQRWHDARADSIVALAVFNGTYVMIGVAFNLVWRYASHRGRLLSRRADPAAISEVHRRYRFGPLYLVCFAVGLLPPVPWTLYISLGLNVALAAFWALPGRVPPRLIASGR
jgi:uncharacterized membrane protein